MTRPELTTLIALPGWCHTDAVVALDWSPDGRVLSVGADGATRVDGMPWSLACSDGPVAACWVGAGRYVCGLGNGATSLIGLHGAQELPAIDPPLTALQWTGDRLVIAAGERLHLPTVSDGAASHPASSPPVPGDVLSRISLDLGRLRAIEPITRAYLVALGAAGIAFVDLGLGLVDVRLMLEGGIAAAADPAGRAVAIGDLAGSIHLLTLGREDDGHELTGYPDPVSRLAWTAGVRGIAAASDDELTFWPVETSEPALEPRTAVAHHHPITALAASPTDPLLATGDAVGRICLWSLRDLTGPVWTHAAGSSATGQRSGGSEITVLAWSPDGGALAAGDVSGTVALWTITAGSIA